MEKPAWQSLGDAGFLYRQRFKHLETKLDTWGRKRDCKACADEEDTDSDDENDGDKDDDNDNDDDHDNDNENDHNHIIS